MFSRLPKILRPQLDAVVPSPIAGACGLGPSQMTNLGQNIVLWRLYSIK